MKKYFLLIIALLVWMFHAFKGNATPTVMDESVVRPRDPIQLFDQKKVVNTTEPISDAVPCGAFRHFTLFMGIDSTLAPTTLQIKVQFLDRWTGKWHTYKQGPFASLYYEDTDTASGIWECLQGMCAGRAMRVTLTGVGTTATAFFTVDISVEFFN